MSWIGISADLDLPWQGSADMNTAMVNAYSGIEFRKLAINGAT